MKKGLITRSPGGIPQTTLFRKEIEYTNRHEVLRGMPGGQELNVCLLAETSTGRLRSWKQAECKKVGPFSGSTLATRVNTVLVVGCIVMALRNHYFASFLSL
jgi:hypothetical protein